MRGWLIYDRAGAERNAWFIAYLVRLSKEYGIPLEVKILEDIQTELRDLPDFAIVRSIAPKLNERLESLGVRTVNNAVTSRIAGDKYETYLRGKEWNIPVLKTWLYDRENLPAEGEFPLVCKTTDGHGGQEVLWIESKEQCPRFKDGRKRILQTPSKVLGKDMRAYVLGGEIVGCVLRESERDFRSNFSLGGKVKPVAPTAEQREIVKTLYEKLRFDYVGVDFLPNGENWVLNEIEDAAGARMLYECTDKDIARLFIVYLKETL